MIQKKKEEIYRYVLIFTVSMTLISGYYNLNLMIAPNPTNAVNVILSVVTFILWLNSIVVIIKQAPSQKKRAQHIAIILIFIIVSIFIAMLRREDGSSYFALAEFFLPAAFLLITPFAGFAACIDQMNIPDWLKLILPYTIFLFVDVLSLFFIVKNVTFTNKQKR